jgi:hypothetical protein
MKVKNYILASFFASSILILCIMPELACVIKEKQPNIYNPDSNLPIIPRDKMQCSLNREKSGEGEDKKRFCEEKETLVETYRLQYKQLMETHRCYFDDLLFTLSIYLAVMGACFTIVCKSIEKMKKKEDSSKTLLFVLIFFAVAVSALFMKGLALGEKDATERASQIIDVANQIDIEPVKVNLLEELFRWIMIGPMIIIALWFAVLLRGMMECGWKQSRVVDRLSSLIGIIWIGVYILSLIPLERYLNLISHELFGWIMIVSTIIVGIWFLVWSIIGVILCRRKKTA